MGKRERGEELSYPVVRHSLQLWEQGGPGATNLVLSGCLEAEVGALRDMVCYRWQNMGQTGEIKGEWI